MTSSTSDAPRLLRVDLSRLAADPAGAVRRERWSDPDPVLDRLGRKAGSALSVALLLARARRRPDADVPLVLAVGSCVRRGLPTAGRVSIASRSPLSGLLSEGQVGSDLGPRLAAVCDALAIEGRTEVPGAVLRIDAKGGVTLESLPELVGADPVRAFEIVRARWGPGALLRVGAAGEAGIPFAGLFAGDELPSFTGRGGLGAVLGRTGLKAVLVEAEAPEPESVRGAAPGAASDEASGTSLRDALAGSPRLVARADEGTMELWHAHAARGDLASHAHTRALDAEAGAALSREAHEAGRARRGCRGCPTPCGWVFETRAGRSQRAHFGAALAVGPNLGLGRFDEALDLHGVCDALGLDARETGTCLALLCRAHDLGRLPGPAPWGDGARLAELVRELVAGTGEGARMARGAVALARLLDLADELVEAKGQAARPEQGEAAVLGQCVSSNGSDPMRSFPFATEGRALEELRRLVPGVELPPGAEDARSPVAKGRLVWWHENLVSAIDASGFCAFSAGCLLTDGACDLDGLARWIAPELEEGAGGVPAGARLLASGASLVLARRALNDLWGAPADQDRPRWAAERLDRPGMLDEYRAWRGIDAAGRPTREAWAALGEARLARGVDEAPDLPRAQPQPVAGPDVRRVAGGGRWVSHAEDGAPASAAGRVRIRCVGPLADALGPADSVELDLPAPLSAVLDALAREHPRAAHLLRRADGAAVPTAYRAGRALQPSHSVADGDVLDLVVAIAGG